ncbi:MAG: hypothetical protein LUQ38_04075, partial [Methanotrichaceae archaeon]|nr:hypothetical protein [Methanotrichaceae archaeon]
MDEANTSSERSLLVYAMQTILVIYAITSIIFGSFATFLEVAFALFMIQLPFMAEKTLLISIPFNLKSIVAVLLTLHMVGNIEHWYYYYYPYFDKIIHFMAGLVLAMLIFVALMVINYYKKKKWDKKIIAALIIMISLPFAIIWEVSEYSIDVVWVKEMHYSLGFWDSWLDIIFDMIAVFIVAVYAYILLSNISYKAIDDKIIKGHL